MIQSPSLSALSLIPAAGDMPLPAVPDGVEVADFGALLALSTGQTVPSAPVAAPLQTELPAPAAPLAGAATAGKDLPLDLPLAVPVSEPERPSLKPKTDAPDPCDLPLPTLPLSKTGIPIQRVLSKAKPMPESRDAASTEASGTAIRAAALPDPALQVQVAQPIATPASAAATQSPPSHVPVMEVLTPAKAEPLPQSSSAPQPVPAALAHAAPQAAFLRAVFPAQPGAEPGAPLAAPAVQPAAPQTASVPSQPIAQVRIELTPAVPVMRALAKEDLRPAPIATLPELSLTPVTTSAPAAISTALAPITHQPMPLADRPQDFSTLIDRLVAAREAAGPQAVAVSVAHADFGQIHLRFRQDEAGLSVAMASADPGFARAASAMPPVLPVGDLQGSQLQPGQRQENTSAPGQPGTGQQRGSANERRDDQPHGNHAPRQTQTGKQQRRPGIFA